MLRVAVSLLIFAGTAAAQDMVVPAVRTIKLNACSTWDAASGRNPTAAELRCRHGIHGPGRFGLLPQDELPVYQPATPLPGNHTVGVPGLPRPAPGESWEEFEWRVLRTRYGAEARRVERGLEALDPVFAERLLRLERRLRDERISAVRRETWRSPERQAFLFQQGRSRPGPFATTTLTSWHSVVDSAGRPAGRAADYSVRAAHLERFHEIVRQVGLQSFGADATDAGHVFLLPPDAVTEREVILLRLLPPVPFLSLTTGRPHGKSLSRSQLAELRRASQHFAASPFLRAPDGRLAGVGILRLPWIEAVTVRTGEEVMEVTR